jgi:hypothetical protein
MSPSANDPNRPPNRPDDVPTVGIAASEGPGADLAAVDSRLTRVAMLLPVIGAPAGLLFAILASLMISGWRVQHSAIVQVDTQWRPGEQLALRVHVQDGEGAGMADAVVQATLRRGEQTAALAEARDVTGGGSTQATLQVPEWDAGPAELELDIRGGGQRFRESVPLTIGRAREARRGTVTISTSVKNWSDDTEPQPERLRIALRPLGRIAAGFDNTLMVRVTDAEGTPHVGPVEVLVLDGEFGNKSDNQFGNWPAGAAPGPQVATRGTTDAQGLLRFDGPLSTDVVRFEVRVLAPPIVAAPPQEGCSKCEAAKAAEAKPNAGKAAKAADAAGTTVPGATATSTTVGTATAVPADSAVEPPPLGSRKFRLVSFAGAVRVSAEPLALRSGATLQINARALRAKKPVFVDLHGPDGAWVDTLTPVTGPEPPREWSTAGLSPGFLQIEAYQFTTSPGESAALARVQITEGEPDTDAALAPLFEQQRAQMSVGRVEKGFDRELERKYLDVIEKAVIPSAEVPLARAWLLGTLPVEVLGPPLALTSLPREQADLAARKTTWAAGLRWFLLGGGGLFLLTTLLLIVISHRRAAAKLTGEIHGQAATAEIAHEIVQAQRAVLLRAVALVVTMALGLVLMVVVLDKLMWSA